jgi:hypothetical protein
MNAPYFNNSRGRAARLIAFHLALCFGFAFLWHWKAPGVLPEPWPTIRMGVLLTVMFQPYCWWIWRLRSRPGAPLRV